jgi:hypothetical protein
MPEDSARVSEHQQRHQPSTPETASLAGDQVLPLALAAYAPGLLGDPRLGGRGNGPVRAALVQRMQQTVGNRAAARLIQRMRTGHILPPLAVQRDDDDNSSVIPPAPSRPLPPPPSAKVAELELSVDVDTSNRSKLGLGDLAKGQVGHAWVKLFWDAKVGGEVPDSVSDPTKAQLKAKTFTSMGFWPLVYRADDWTDVGKKAREDKVKGIPDASPQSGASDNPEHSGFSIFNKYVPGRVEQPDKSSHTAKAFQKYKLSLSEVVTLAAYADSKRNAQYNLYEFNCTTFAVEATAAAGQSPPSGEGFRGITYPNALYAQLYEAIKASNKSGYDASKGYLASLGADEQHVKPPKKNG